MTLERGGGQLDGPEQLPLLPLKDVVVFPRMVVPLLVGRPASLAAVEEGLASGRPLFLCAQRDPEIEDPVGEDLHSMGVTANVLQTLRMPDGTMKVVVEGIERCTLERYIGGSSFPEARVKPIVVRSQQMDKSTTALMRVVVEQFEDHSRLGQRISPEVAMAMTGIEDPATLADLVSSHLSLSHAERQKLLEIRRPKKRLEELNAILVRENELFEIERKVRDRVRDQMERGQREHYLHEQIRALQQELGQKEDGDEFSELREMIEKAKMPKDVKEKAERELVRYERMPPMSPESAVIRTYIEWLSDLPWSKRTKDNIQLEKAKKILDEDHYGLEKVKDRILEFLAVRKLSKSTKGPVLCLVGAPGVGKTSLGKSVARAMGREFIRVSLGGIRDEAEIRGHRRTYIGSLPGRIIQSMKKCGVKNPTFMLDEIDKINADFRGDPASALLEVLDPEQNRAFSDHFLEVDFDLHEVFFITTANSEYDIPEPLLDRMEVVNLSGYTPLEKEAIAKLFLIPKQLEASGLAATDIDFTAEGLDLIIHRYTHEAGVRELERQIAAVCRKVVRRVVEGKKKKGDRAIITADRVIDMLGPPPYTDIADQSKPEIGVATGLAWTSAGGDILSIETTTMKGKGNLQLTGQLGEVMQESAQAAYTYLRAHAKELKISSEFWKSTDIHIHVPEGAIPKDGPSAGVALTVSMLSALSKKMPAAKLAMTGEITLRGKVLGVGGLKEKVLAAHRAGMTTVLIPKENEKDLVDVPKEISENLRFVQIESIDEALAVALPSGGVASRKQPKAKRKPLKAKRKPLKAKRKPLKVKRAAAAKRKPAARQIKKNP